MIGIGILGLASCGQTHSQECAQSCSLKAQGAAATWGGRKGRGRACCRKGQWIRDFCSKENSKQWYIRAVIVSSRFRQDQAVCFQVFLPALSAGILPSATVAVHVLTWAQPVHFYQRGAPGFRGVTVKLKEIPKYP